MANNRKFKNGMFRDVSKLQDKISSDLFLRLQDLLRDDFKSMAIRFDQLTGQCEYEYETKHYTYTMLVDRGGKILQESNVIK